MFKAVRCELDRARTAGVVPSALLLLGDQIYYDATAELFETERVRGKFLSRYLHAYTGHHFRDVIRRIPTYMTIDDHELLEGWEPGIEHNSVREQTRALGIKAFQCFQWLHGPRNGKRDDGSPASGSTFESSQFPFFAMDTRTERCRSPQQPSADAAYLVSRSQLKALKSNLQHAQDRFGARPKFVAASSVLAPALKSTMCHPATWMSDDSWSGFPATRDALLRFIARRRIENVVFLAGDVHCSMVAELVYQDVTTASEHPLKSYCVTASPFYSPYPFINSTRCEFACTGAFGTPAIAHYNTKAQSWVECDSFSRVDTWQDDRGRWRLDITALDANGSTLTTTEIVL